MLEKIANSYMDFLDRAGTEDRQYFQVQVPKLFAANCQKIVNGKVNVASRDAFEEYFLNAQKNYGNWHINQNRHFYPCEKQSVVTIKYIAETTELKLLVLVTIKINQEGLIEEIFEIDTLIEDLQPHVL